MTMALNAPSRTRYQQFISDFAKAKLRALKLEQSGSQNLTEVVRQKLMADNVSSALLLREDALDSMVRELELLESGLDLDRVG